MKCVGTMVASVRCETNIVMSPLVITCDDSEASGQ
jgi:hypothetical protein